MTDRAAPDVRQEPADGTPMTAPQDAETRSKPEISEPMLDVDAPHPTVHTWKNFFHIAAITLGLLIALGLEATVEWARRGKRRGSIAAAT
jgi:hypothetical protein